jgi:FlaA1/EpsC-like NDP-sugar epimerase
MCCVGAEPLSARTTNTGVFAAARRTLIELPRLQKRFLLIAIDFALFSFALWCVVSVRLGYYFVPDNGVLIFLCVAAPTIGVGTLAWAGLYRLVTRFMGPRGFTQIFLTTGLAVLIWSSLVLFTGQSGLPRSAIVPFALLAATFICISRQMASLLLRSAGIRPAPFTEALVRKPIAIFGAGPMGADLLQAIRRSGNRDVVGFIDPAPSLRGQYVGGVKVYPPNRIGKLIENAGVKEVLIALPHGLRRERRTILRELERYPIEVKVLPDFEDVTAGQVGLNDLRPVDVGDLLGRDQVKPDAELLARTIRNKSILVTGAGGSIGSELVRQILRQNPKSVVLFDISEVALYEIEMEINETLSSWSADQVRPTIHGVLGSVLDAALVAETIRRHNVKTIYHAAAYKHVPIVENNIIAGLQNNTFGVAVIAECALRLDVERVILISTDKAVRPTNVMGASKRLAELVLQSMAADRGGTIFSMVRFGNVLDSSGSVVRRFRKQIAAGGPVTVTHKEIVRYFMSIPEAAELVIQAGAMARGGEVFVLHMGDPVKIDDLARLMIHLSGLEVRDDANPAGDIQITYTGLRPGEKLYEELLIGAHTTGTEHPRIMRSAEPVLPAAELKRELDLLQTAMTMRDIPTIQDVLLRTVEGYHPEGEVTVLTEPARVEAGKPSAARTLH